MTATTQSSQQQQHLAVASSSSVVDRPSSSASTIAAPFGHSVIGHDNAATLSSFFFPGTSAGGSNLVPWSSPFIHQQQQQQSHDPLANNNVLLQLSQSAVMMQQQEPQQQQPYYVIASGFAVPSSTRDVDVDGFPGGVGGSVSSSSIDPYLTYFRQSAHDLMQHQQQQNCYGPCSTATAAQHHASSPSTGSSSSSSSSSRMITTSSRGVDAHQHQLEQTTSSSPSSSSFTSATARHHHHQQQRSQTVTEPPTVQTNADNSSRQQQQQQQASGGAPAAAAAAVPMLATSATDSCSQITHVLQCFQQGGEDGDFVRKAIESLVKKLKDKRIELDALIVAVTSSGKQPSGCVTIQRSLDGRVQVAGRKGVPHVVYARIWRWPDVGKNELQKLSCCAIANDNQDYICINPYHYERVVSSICSSLDTPPLRLTTGATATIYHDNPSSGQFGGHHQQQSQLAQPYGVQTEFDFDGAAGWPPHQQHHHHHHRLSPLSDYPSLLGDTHHPLTTDSFGGGAASSSCVPSSFAVRSLDELNQLLVPLSQSVVPEQWGVITYLEFDTPIGDAFKVPWEQSEVSVDGGMDPFLSGGRFCLGALPNVHRSEAAEKARLHVGGGVRLRHDADGSLWMTVLSAQPVFLRSPFLDWQLHIHHQQQQQPPPQQSSGVHRLTADGRMHKIFDLRWAYAEMQTRTRAATRSAVVHAAARAGYPLNEPSDALLDPSPLAACSVDELRTVFCQVALSFVKGWGGHYQRKEIKETPCWVEIQLHRPLQLLDQLLKS